METVDGEGALTKRVERWFPAGTSLPHDTWELRHAGVLALLAVHALALVAFGLGMRLDPVHVLAEGSVVVLFGLVAWWPRFSRRMRSVVAGAGLMTCSGILVHFSGGYIEAHFHFFVVLGVIFLYEDWVPYVLAVTYVAVHHGIAGTLDPLSVYNHPDAVAHPWRWAAIHAAFILGLSAALLVAWNVIDRARASQSRALGETHELKRQLESQEKMAALGSLVAGLAHEVKTPLTIVATNASLLERAAARAPQNALSPAVAEAALDIQASVERINALVHQLRRFHALGPDERRVVPLDSVVREALHLFATANKDHRPLEVALAPTPPARLHVFGVQQVVLNLVTNAVEATDPTRGVVRVRTATEGRHAVLVVEDNGVGMNEETVRRAFDPLFTTKPEGMGLGLHIVRRIIDAQEGDIAVHSAPGTGTRFIVRFPLPSAEEPKTAAPVLT